MPSQAHELPTNRPIAEGVQHGPYEHDGTAYSQSNGLDNAVEAAHNTGAISYEQHEKLREGVGTLIVKEYDKEYDADADADEAALAQELDEQEAYDSHMDAQEEQEALDEEDNEDPLEGDVDRWVSPEETSDHIGYPDAHSANVARQHGDFTG